MPENHPSDLILNLERQILRALCSREMPFAVWDRLAASLSGYSWQDPDHRVVYDALRGIRSHDANTRREELPAQATRMGFPDVDWSIYFTPEEFAESEIDELIQRVKTEPL